MRRPFVRSLLIGLIVFVALGAVKLATVSAATIHHYEYVFTSGFIYVYDIDNAGALVKTITVPTGAGVRGAVANVATGNLYISYGSDAGSGGSQLAYNLATDQIVWTKTYPHGIDSQAISPDGTKIYMPSGELSSGSTWYVEDPATGNDIGTVVVGGTGNGSGTGPHNTIVTATRVYMGLRDDNLGGGNGINDFGIGNTSTNQIIGKVTPTRSGVRPFTINSKETLLYTSVTGFLGFQVGDLTTGNVIYTVPIDGSNIPGFTTSFSVTDPSHGIALSADDKTLYLVDWPNNYVHVFDVSGVPASAPVQVADIALPDSFTPNQAQCAYDCGGDGWLHLSSDGKYLFVGDTPDVISTSTRTLAMKMPQLANSRVEIEIDFQDTTPIWAMNARASFGHLAGPPPPLTVRPVVIVIGENENGSNTETGMPWLDALGAQYSSATQYYANTHPSIGNYEGMTNGIVETNDDSQCPQTFTITADNVVRQLIAAGKPWKQYAESIPSVGYIGCDATGPDGGTFYTRHAPLPYYSDAQTAAQKVNIVPFTQFAADLAAGTLPAYSFVTPNGCDDGHDCSILTFDNWLQANIAPLLTNPQFVQQGGVLIITWDESANDNTNGGGRVQFVVAGPNVKKAYKSTTLYQEGSLCRWSMELSGAAVPSGCAASPTMAEFIVGTTPPPPPPTPAIATTSLPGATQNVAYNATLSATGGTAPYTWSIASGTLPAGLALAPSTGAISGTPTGTGTSTFTVRVTDANSMAATKSLSVTVTATPAAPSITTASLPGATQNVAYNTTLSATGGTAPYTWSIASGTLPAGLALAPSTGAISGTPTGTGTSTFTVRVTDANSMAATKSLSVTVTATAAPSVTATSGTPQSATIDTAFGATLTATVRNGGGQPQAGVTVTFTAPAQTGPSGAFAGGLNTATTNASGVATSAVFTANSIAGGPYVVSASIPGAATPASFLLTNNSKLQASVKVKAGAPQRSFVDTALPVALEAMVTDANGNPVPNASVIFTAPSNGPSGTFPGGGISATATTNASGVATATTFTANNTAGGPYNVTASIAGTGASATFSLTNLDFALAQSVPGTVQFTAGTPANIPLTLTTTPAGSTLPADVYLSCAIPTSVSTTTCALNPAKISANSPSGSGATLTITSTAGLPPLPRRQGPKTPYLPWGAVTALAGLVAIYLAARMKVVPLRGRMAYLALALLAITSAGLMGCVGLLPSQKGPSSVTVTATSGGISKTTTITINMK